MLGTVSGCNTMTSQQIQDGERWSPYWKSFSSYISAPDWPINATFRTFKSV